MIILLILGNINMELNEPILTEDLNRFVLFPIKYDDMWEMYNDAIASFWTVSEVDLSEDVNDWENKLSANERHFLSHVLAFFASADNIVVENLAANFLKEVCIPEARQYFSIQIAIEGIHAHMYATLIDTYIKDVEEKSKLFNAITTMPVITKKLHWSLKYMDKDKSFHERLIAFAILEGVFFCGAFCAIYFFKTKGVLPGLCFSNELIAGDEQGHALFDCLLYRHLMLKVSKEVVYEMFQEAVLIEKEFIREALPVSLIGMNADLMGQYIEFVADCILYALGYDKLYKTQNPFDFMEMLSLEGKTNFFEKRVSSYQKAGVALATKQEDTVFTIDDDF